MCKCEHAYIHAVLHSVISLRAGGGTRLRFQEMGAGEQAYDVRLAKTPKGGRTKL